MFGNAQLQTIGDYLINLLINSGTIGVIVLIVLLGARLFPKLFHALFVTTIKYALNGSANPTADSSPQKNDDHLKALMSDQRLVCKDEFSKMIKDSDEQILTEVKGVREDVKGVHTRIDNLMLSRGPR